MSKIRRFARFVHNLLVSILLTCMPLLGMVVPAAAEDASISLRLPWQTGDALINGGNTYGCGDHTNRDYYALDFQVGINRPISSVANGVAHTATQYDASGKGYGQYVWVAHANGYVSMYTHLNSYAANVDGKTVQQGEVIGYAGNTGTEAVHLHFVLRKNATNDTNGDAAEPIPMSGYSNFGSVPCGGTSQNYNPAVNPPGGWWQVPTPADNSMITPGATVNVSAHGVDNGNGGLDKVNLTYYDQGVGWKVLKTTWYTSTPTGDAAASFIMPDKPYVMLGFDVYSKNGNYQKSPNGLRKFCNAWTSSSCSHSPSDGGQGPVPGGGSGSNGQTNCVPGQYQASVFVDANYGGTCVTKDVGTYNDASAIGLPDNSITSVKVGSGASLVLCDNTGINSPCEWFTADDPDLTNNMINTNTTSSLRIEGNQPTTGCNPGITQVSFFVDQNYGGACITKNVGVYSDPGAIGLPNDSISSIKVGANAKVRVCENAGMNSPCVDFDRDDDRLGYFDSISDNSISAAEVSIKGGIRLCDNTNYGGECKYFGTGKYNLQDYGFNNRTESVIYDDSWANLYHIVLYTDDNQTGYLYHADNSVNDLRDPYNNNISSIDIYKHDPPQAMMGEPADGAVLNTNNVTLNFDGGDNRRVHAWGPGFDQTLDWTTAKTWQLNNLVSGTYSWQVQAHGVAGDGNWSPVRTFTVNGPPTIANGDFSMTAGTTQSIQVQAYDAENNPITLTATNKPSWASFVDNGGGIGTLTFTPDAYVSGSSQITINASDGTSSSNGVITVSVAPGQATPNYQANYYNNITLSGTPVLTRQEPQVNYWWNAASPDPSVNADNFSARWSKVDTFNDGLYTFQATGDDGIRLYIDGQMVVDKWIDQGASRYYVDKQMTQGNHSIVMEYYEKTGGATAVLSYAPTDTSKQFTAEYFNNTSLTGTPVVTRTENGLDYWWGSASPAPGVVNADNFSARWTRTQDFAAGTYKFTASGDDGMRLFVDGQQVINGWSNPGTTNNGTVDVPLTAGQHTIVYEYYENGGWASTKLVWSSAVVSQINSSADDAEQSAKGTVTLNSQDIELTCDTITIPCPSSDPQKQTVGLRFTGLNIPRGATINSAFIEFTASEAQSETTNLTFNGQAADNAATFTTAKNNISSRTKTNANILWLAPPAWTVGGKYQTPNVASIMQEIVNRPGWSSGNAAAFIVTGLGHRTADAFDKPGGIPVKLTVTFTAP